MEEREIGVEEARKVLGNLADDAALDGRVTYLTRHRRRVAAIVPLDLIKEPPVKTYTYAIEASDDGEIWMMDVGDATGQVVDNRPPAEIAAELLEQRLDNLPGDLDDFPADLDDGWYRLALWEGDNVEYIGLAVAVETRTPEQIRQYLGAEPTKYVAAIGAASDVVAGDFCDVSVITSEVVSYRASADSESIPMYGLTDNVVMAAQELTVRTDADDKLDRIEGAAEDILSANGWRVIGKWEISDNAAYADVERA